MRFQAHHGLARCDLEILQREREDGRAGSRGGLDTRGHAHAAAAAAARYKNTLGSDFKFCLNQPRLNIGAFCRICFPSSFPSVQVRGNELIHELR